MPALAELGSLSKDELAIELLPRVCGVCLATTSAPVRTAAVQAMGRLVKLVDDEQAAKMLATCQQARLPNHDAGDMTCPAKLSEIDSVAPQPVPVRTKHVGSCCR